MRTKLEKILDECLSRISGGEAIGNCLPEDAEIRKQLEPLLQAALAVSSMPTARPSDNFRKTAKGRLIARLHQEATQTKVATLEQGMPLLDDLATAGQRLWQALTGLKKVVVPVTLGLAIILAASFGASNFISPPTTLAAGCTLSIFSGNVEIQAPEAEGVQLGADGMTLDIGTRIKTAPDSHALLTFFDGSTLKLEPETDIEIQQLAYDEEESITIVLKQWMGQTWSRVVKMADAGSHYEIETPTAYAIVRGTLFTTEVDEAGDTTVATTEGLVSVVAQGEEVYIPPEQQTQVASGATPSQPTSIPSPEAEILIDVDTTAVASVIDPTGASTGCLEDGLSFNQIPGSQSSAPAADGQVITIPQPRSGEYTVVLRYTSEGTAHLNIQGKSDGKIAFKHADNYEGTSESGWLVHIELDVEDGLIVGSEVTGVEPLIDETPEKIVKTDLTKVKKTAPVEPSSPSPEYKPAQGNGNKPAQPNKPDQGNKPAQPNDNLDLGNTWVQPSIPGKNSDPGSNQNQGKKSDPGITPDKNPVQPNKPDTGKKSDPGITPDKNSVQPNKPDTGKKSDPGITPDKNSVQPNKPDTGKKSDSGITPDKKPVQPNKPDTGNGSDQGNANGNQG